MCDCLLCKATHPLSNPKQDKRESWKEEPESQPLEVESSDEDLGQARMHGRSVLMADWKQAYTKHKKNVSVPCKVVHLPSSLVEGRWWQEKHLRL